MNQQITIKAAVGLSFTSNSLTAPDGAYEVADNITITRDGIAQKRRGFEALSESITSPLAVTEYLDNLYVAYNSKLGQVNTTTGVITDLTGALNTASKPRFALQAGALFMTSDNGPRKVETSSATETIRDVGVSTALDLNLTLDSGSDGALESDTQTAYRVLFGRTDDNDNLLLGAPSELTTITNAQEDATYSRSGTTVTVTTSPAHGLTGTWLIKVTEADDAGLETASVVATYASSTTFTYTSTATGASTGDLKWGYLRNVDLNFTVPSDLTTDYFYQIYRSQPSLSDDTDPEENLQLVEQVQLTSTDISNGYVDYTDTLPKELLGAALYTNPNQEGIAQANNQPPKCSDIENFKNVLFYANTESKHSKAIKLTDTSASTIANTDWIAVVHKADTETVTDVSWQSGTTVRYTFTTATISPAVATGQYITFSGMTNSTNDGTYEITAINAAYVDVTNANRTDATDDETPPAAALALPTRVYKAAASESTGTTYGGDFKLTAATAASFVLPIDQTARSLGKVINRDSNSFTIAQYTSGIEDTPGDLLLTSNDFAEQFYIVANDTGTGGAFSPALPATGETIISSNDDLQNLMFFSKVNEPEAVPLVNFIAVGSKSEAILRIVALRDSLIIIKEDGVFALRGDSPSNFVVTLLDNTVICKALDSVTTLSNQVYMVSNQGVVTISESGVSVISRAIESKFNAAFPNSNYSSVTHAVGYESERLYVVSTMTPFATTTADTVYVYNYVTGAWTNWDTTFNDAIVFSGSDKLYLLDTNDDIISERKNFNKLDYTDRDFDFTTKTVNSGTEVVVTHASGEAPAQGDALVIGQVINRVDSVVIDSATQTTVTLGSAGTFRDGQNTQFTSQTYARVSTTVTVTTGVPHGVATSSTFEVEIEDATDAGVNTTQVTATATGASTFTFTTAASGADGTLTYGIIDTGSTHKGYNSKITTTPLDAGDVSRWKHFTEFQLHFRARSASYVDVNFANEAVRTSTQRNWQAKYGTQGWGTQPWGQYEWGENDTFNSAFDSQPSQPLRVYLPLDVAKGTFIQAIVENNVATEAFDIQALSFTVRGFGQRIIR